MSGGSITRPARSPMSSPPQSRQPEPFELAEHFPGLNQLRQKIGDVSQFLCPSGCSRPRSICRLRCVALGFAIPRRHSLPLANP
jgi:hypothetical protein